MAHVFFFRPDHVYQSANARLVIRGLLGNFYSKKLVERVENSLILFKLTTSQFGSGGSTGTADCTAFNAARTCGDSKKN